MFAGFIEAGAKIATDRWIAALAGKIIGITGKIGDFTKENRRSNFCR
jgi:hypothetical protein